MNGGIVHELCQCHSIGAVVGKHFLGEERGDLLPGEGAVVAPIPELRCGHAHHCAQVLPALRRLRCKSRRASLRPAVVEP